MKHHSLVVDFANLDFEKFDTEILVDKAKELEETNTVATIVGDVIEMGSSDPGKKDEAKQRYLFLSEALRVEKALVTEKDKEI